MIAIVSGGLDSVALAYHLHSQGHDLRMLSVDYGQRHRKEHAYAELAAKRLSVPHETVDLRGIAGLLPGYSLTDDEVGVPDQHYTAPGSVNVVPNRNVILLSVAYAAAAAVDADQVAMGSVAEDAVTGSDCSPAFIESFNAMERIACAGYAPEQLSVVAPFITWPKHEVIKRGEELGVPWQETWSCFKGREEQCGVCAACHDRRQAFVLADVHDPTVYTKG
ncbi:7-cyano-7-deazaguanine synthase [Streptomyces iconiensis]|uniref:7-cyano-7-deazaguanine synthase n=1 Tax=Streptomyces iconiensis TaxID=1384038 RepID=A0ABT7A0C0_9ACTN|nr:7-cyano-7-deazaguanine synthase [Streptomyces iconiensis]MDJ1134777.1 7-cyano-7-deazaguanine synthase [Streptomyces iconiensis]